MMWCLNWGLKDKKWSKQCVCDKEGMDIAKGIPRRVYPKAWKWEKHDVFEEIKEGNI